MGDIGILRQVELPIENIAVERSALSALPYAMAEVVLRCCYIVGSEYSPKIRVHLEILRRMKPRGRLSPLVCRFGASALLRQLRW